jgi:exonuclease III
MWLATWNVQSLDCAGALQNLKDLLRRYGIGIAALQEMRWKNKGIIKSEEFTIIYSGGEDNTFGTGFIIHKKYKHAIMNYEMCNVRLCTLRIKGTFFYTSLISVHAPIEEKEEEKMDEFYDKLSEIYNNLPGHDVKMILGDFNAKIGREGLYQSITGKESLHKVCNDNGWRLVDFATTENMKVVST